MSSHRQIVQRFGQYAVLLGRVSWFWLNGRRAGSRVCFIFERVVSLLLVIAALSWGAAHFSPLISMSEVSALPQSPANTQKRYGFRLSQRRAIFFQIAKEEQKRLENPKNSRPWIHSVRGHNATSEHGILSDIANKRGVHVSVIYAILQEGIEKRWVSDSVTEPLQPSAMF